ncbi:hypothetical protein M8494_21805 [Serratia ureilytica]
MVDAETGHHRGADPWAEATTTGLPLSAATGWRCRVNARCISSAPKAYSTARTLAPIGGKTLNLPARWPPARQLLGFERGEEDSPTAASGKRKSIPEIFTAVDGDRVLFSMNPIVGSAPCSIAVNGKTGEVAGTALAHGARDGKRAGPG